MVEAVKLTEANSTCLRGMQINNCPPPPYEKYSAHDMLFRGNEMTDPRVYHLRDICRLALTEHRAPERLPYRDLKDIEKWLKEKAPNEGDFLPLWDCTERCPRQPPMYLIAKCQANILDEDERPIAWFIALRTFTHYVLRVDEHPTLLHADDQKTGVGREPLDGNQPHPDAKALLEARQVAEGPVFQNLHDDEAC